MKKLLLIFALVAFAGTLYFVIASRAVTPKVVPVRTNISAANRNFLNEAGWGRWFPRQYTYKITGIYYNEVRFLLRGMDQRDYPVSLRIAPLAQDSLLIGWQGDLPAASRRQMDTAMEAFRAFAEDVRNIYGVAFQRTFSKDSTLITLTGVETRYPETEYIYRKIDTLRAYAASQGAKVIDYPMLSVTADDSTHFRIMVALSLDKTLAGNRRIVIKRFVPWKMIEGQVQGGVSEVERAFRQMFNYRDDQHLSIMALPFQSLVTDRRQEPDSARWVTKVCAPIS